MASKRSTGRAAMSRMVSLLAFLPVASRVPDTVPLIGGLDDIVIVVLAVDLFLDGVPPELLQEKLDDLAIDRASFDRDVAQIRRLTPGPVRRTIRRIPGLMAAAGRAIDQSGVVPRARAWITKEG